METTPCVEYGVCGDLIVVGGISMFYLLTGDYSLYRTPNASGHGPQSAERHSLC